MLVIGQVEDDASIKFGAPKGTDNGTLIQLAKKQHPDSELLFRIHPDVLAGKRSIKTPLNEISKYATITTPSMALSYLLENVDHVYVITSLTGFEALMYDKPVTVLGQPFYSGWGLTNDINPLARRNITLSLEELFVGAYIRYPLYFDINTGEPSTIEDALDFISNNLKSQEKDVTEPPKKETEEMDV